MSDYFKIPGYEQTDNFIRDAYVNGNMNVLLKAEAEHSDWDNILFCYGLEDAIKLNQLEAIKFYIKMFKKYGSKWKKFPFSKYDLQIALQSKKCNLEMIKILRESGGASFCDNVKKDEDKNMWDPIKEVLHRGDYELAKYVIHYAYTYISQQHIALAREKLRDRSSNSELQKICRLILNVFSDDQGNQAQLDAYIEANEKWQAKYIECIEANKKCETKIEELNNRMANARRAKNDDEETIRHFINLSKNWEEKFRLASIKIGRLASALAESESNIRSLQSRIDNLNSNLREETQAKNRYEERARHFQNRADHWQAEHALVSDRAERAERALAECLNSLNRRNQQQQQQQSRSSNSESAQPPPPPAAAAMLWKCTTRYGGSATARERTNSCKRAPDGTYQSRQGCIEQCKNF